MDISVLFLQNGNISVFFSFKKANVGLSFAVSAATPLHPTHAPASWVFSNLTYQQYIPWFVHEFEETCISIMLSIFIYISIIQYQITMVTWRSAFVLLCILPIWHIGIDTLKKRDSGWIYSPYLLTCYSHSVLSTMGNILG